MGNVLRAPAPTQLLGGRCLCLWGGTRSSLHEPRLWAEPRAGSGADPAGKGPKPHGCSCPGSLHGTVGGISHRAEQPRRGQSPPPAAAPTCPLAIPRRAAVGPGRAFLLPRAIFAKLLKREALGTRTPSPTPLNPVTTSRVTSGCFSLQEEGGSQRSLPGPTAARPSPRRRVCPRASGRPPSPRCTRRATATAGLPSPTACGRTGRRPQVGLEGSARSGRATLAGLWGGCRGTGEGPPLLLTLCFLLPRRFDAVPLQPAHHAAPQRGGDGGPHRPAAAGHPRQPAPRLGRGAQAPALLPVRNPFGQ